MTWQQFLTEKVLGKCYHDGSSVLMAGYHCKKCDKIFTCNRTYSTDADMMALYRAINRKGVWGKFFDWAYEEYWKENSGTHRKFTAWLFCFDEPELETAAVWWLNGG